MTIERSQADFYADPVLYDVLHAPGTWREARGLERIARRFLPDSVEVERLTWLEPACGTGRYLRLLGKRGHRVLGFDTSPEMVEYARARLDPFDARVFVADMADFTRSMAGERPHVAFNLVNSIRHLETDDAMVGHLRDMRRVLRQGGLYVVGLHLSAYGLEPITEDVWEGARGSLRVTQVVQYEPPRGSGRRERVVSEMVVATPRRERHVGSVYHLRTYSRAQWRGVVERAGLRIAGVVDEQGRDAGEAEGAYALFVLQPT